MLHWTCPTILSTKSFLRLNRMVNLQLIQRFVDPEAQEVKIGDQGFRVKMQFLESILSDNLEYSSSGKMCKQHYPAGLNNWIDGQRHPDVQSSIEKGTVKTTTLQP
jgi:hypothetical protein